MSKARIRLLLAGLLVGVATTVLMLTTEPYLAIVWDEGYTLGREERIRLWFHALLDPSHFAATWRPPVEELVQKDGRVPPPQPYQLDSRSKLLFDSKVLAWFWPFAREEPHGHPPFYALLGLAGDVLAPSWPVLARGRLGPILLFSMTAGVIATFMAARFGRWPAALAVASWALQPNLFAHGHYAAYDAILTCLWVLAIVAFTQAVSAPSATAAPPRLRWGWTVAFGVIVGCAFATKLTGWFLPLPFLVWATLFRQRRAFQCLVGGVIVALATVYIMIPPWWLDPFGGIVRFFESNLTRGDTIVIPVQFFHRLYVSPRESLPWFNTIAWTVLVTPVGFAVLGFLGFWATLRTWRSEPIGLLISGHWMFLMLLRALPHAPAHDGVRLFLPAFGVFALLGGIGARFLLDRFGGLARALIFAAIVEGAISVSVMMPVPLSYYSPIVGGLRGATALGMEPTYYWDGLLPGARRWLREHTPPGRTIRFVTVPTSWIYLRSIGELPRQVVPFDPGLPLWVVLQNRPGLFSDVDRALIARATPAYTETKFGVPLVWIFPYSDFERLSAEQRR